MEFIRNFPLFSIILCLLSSVVCSVVKGRGARAVTLTAMGLISLMSAAVALFCLQTGEPFIYTMGHIGAPWGNELRGGILEGLIASAAGLVLLLSVGGGFRFITRDIAPRKENLYYLLINLVGAACTALIYTNDIFTGYVFLEILTLSSCGILMIRDIGKTTLAATRYLILNLMGSGLFLLGIILSYDITGHLLMENMGAAFQNLALSGEHAITVSVAVGLICVGLAIKSGLFPFHFWMQDTYGSATPSSAAVLSGVVSKGYIFLLVKIICRVVGIDSPFLTGARTIFLVFGMMGIVYGSIGAMRQSSVNKMIALSSAAQIGYIYVGLGLGTKVGLCAAFIQLLAHMLTKPLLFLAAARLTEVSGGSPMFHNLLGSAGRDPFAGAMFSMGAFSMMGIPIFAGFVAKLYFCAAAVEIGGLVEWSVLLVLAVSTVLNTYYFIRTVIRIYSPVPEKEAPPKHELGFIAASLALVALNIVLGVWSDPIARVITRGLEMLS